MVEDEHNMKNYTGRIGHLAKTAGKYNIFDFGLESLLTFCSVI